jgi:hypothetical protein
MPFGRQGSRSSDIASQVRVPRRTHQRSVSCLLDSVEFERSLCSVVWCLFAQKSHKIAVRNVGLQICSPEGREPCAHLFIDGSRRDPESWEKPLRDYKCNTILV